MSDTVPPVFCHMKSAKISKGDIKKLSDAGYIVIAVDSFDDFKVIDSLQIGTGNMLAKAAFHAIRTSTWASVHEKFGLTIAKALTDKPVTEEPKQ